MVGESFNWSTFGVVDGGQYSGDLVRVTGKGLEGCFTLDSEPGSTLERAMAGAMGGGPMSLSSLARLECLSMKPVTADATSSTAPTLPRWFLKAMTVNMSLPGTDEEDRIAAKCFLQKVMYSYLSSYLCVCLSVSLSVSLSIRWYVYHIFLIRPIYKWKGNGFIVTGWMVNRESVTTTTIPNRLFCILLSSNVCLPASGGLTDWMSLTCST